MRFGGLNFFLKKIEGLAAFRYRQKSDCYYNDTDKKMRKTFWAFSSVFNIQKFCGCFWENFQIGLKVRFESICKSNETRKVL